MQPFVYLGNPSVFVHCQIFAVLCGSSTGRAIGPCPMLERTEMGLKAYLLKGGKLGRSKGSNESVKQFMSKPNSQKIISLLKQGKSTRDIAARIKVSTATVVKVRKYLNNVGES